MSGQADHGFVFANKKKIRKTLLFFSLDVRKCPDNLRTTLGHLSPKCPNDVLSMSAQIASPKLIASPSTPRMHQQTLIIFNHNSGQSNLLMFSPRNFSVINAADRKSVV
jgi:hypothetical protein